MALKEDVEVNAELWKQVFGSTIEQNLKEKIKSELFLFIHHFHREREKKVWRSSC